MLNRYQEKIIEIIHKHLPHARIILFGSRARNTHQEGADVDIAVDTGKKLNLNTTLTIKDEIEETTTLPVFIDIVDIQSASEELKEEIEKDGIVWTE